MDEKKEVKKTVKKTIKKKPKFPTKRYELIADVTIGDKKYKKGDSVSLTIEGERSFRKQFYIK